VTDRTVTDEAVEVRALELDHRALGRMIEVRDYKDERYVGRLTRLEISEDERTRVCLRIAKEFPTESGGTYWSDFLSEVNVSRDATVLVRSAAGRWQPDA
jgi:hypothetical protein